MISRWFKRHFIPHKGNNHRPQFLHGPNARKIVLVILTLELLFFVLPVLFFTQGSNFLALVLPSVLNNLTNEKRIALNLNTLAPSITLETAAILKAQDMATKGYFAHNSPDGLTPWYWLGLAGYKYSMAGENLAVNFTDSRDVTEAWMNSPTHRDNIVKQGFTEIGTAAATGFYNGREATFVVQYYARPSIVAPVQSRPVAVAPTSETVPIETVVLGEEAPAPTFPPSPVEEIKSFVEETSASPKHFTNIALMTILSLIALALLINLVTRVSSRHPNLVTNGLALAVLIFGIYLFNNYLFAENPVVSLEPAESSFVTFQ